MPAIDTPITREELMKPLKVWKTDRLVVDLVDDGNVNAFRLSITSEDGAWPSREATIEFASRFPQLKKSKHSMDRVLVVPATDISVQLIHGLWPQGQVKWAPDAHQVFKYLFLTVQHQRLAMVRTAEYREYLPRRADVAALAASTKPVALPFPLADGQRPMLHQSVGLANCTHSDGYGLFMEQGTGKTLVVIGRVDKESLEKSNGEMYRVLITAPKNVRSNWASEFARFSAVHGKVTVLRGGQIERMKLFFQAMIRDGEGGQNYTVVVVSYECLSNDWDLLSKIPWDLAVLDESHFIKWHDTKRTKHAMKLREVAKARMALTGTPVCNTVMDLFTQLEFLREGGSGFTSFDAFRKFYGVYETRDPERGTKRLVNVQNLPFMRERLARMSFIVRQAEALPDLPDMVYDIVEVEMTNEQADVYNKVADQLFAEINSDMESGDKRRMTANNILTKLLRLAQVTSGFVSFDPIVDLDSGEEIAPREIEAFDPNPKLQELVELLKERPHTSKTLIWAHFRFDAREIMRALEENAEEYGGYAVKYTGETNDADREEAVRAFNEDPRCKFFVGSAGAGGTGLTLLGYPPGREKEYETNCDMEVFYSQDWSHPKRAQAEKRPYRKGTRCHIRVVDLTVIGTIDEEIRERVTNKRVSALQVQDLREILAKVLKRR